MQTPLRTWLVQDYPDLFHAFVSSGQMVNTTENDVMDYEFALEYLAEQGDTDRIETLRRNGPPPYTEGNLVLTYAAYLGALNDYMALHAHGEGKDADILVDAINEPEYGLLGKMNWVRGLMNVFNVVYPQLEDLDFTTQAAELEVPVYFFVGRYDVNAMASLAERYYDVLDAPYKENARMTKAQTRSRLTTVATSWGGRRGGLARMTWARAPSAGWSTRARGAGRSPRARLSTCRGPAVRPSWSRYRLPHRELQDAEPPIAPGR